ncbi:hypothetical protein PR202_gb03523 [Eleusine coracana subsp. coracana]|uniref:DUF1279 domain-containing protein n=1 Tax=Eleusine coracana subsp. coracana TaxID=191504 RepID=A0AAV5E0I6_ELECO|nr:hypothetical protein QOZ80_6BG0481810 [Eleusine coracana subsp. coracana]GJN16524.1 hypothetical protein PR202_gb03523 [Eleusine coracana subsp. coracana]
MAFTGRMKHLMKKYGKVALGVHVSVSCTTIAGLYVAINNNVDVDSLLRRVGISPSVSVEAPPAPASAAGDDILGDAAAVPNRSEVVLDASERERERNRTAELVASSGGALALAVLCNKALLPVRIPMTIALTPPISRALQRWRLIKS